MTYRTVIRTEEFEFDLMKIEPDTRRCDEFLEGIEYILARNPEVGLDLLNGVHSLDSSEWSWVEPLTVFYEYDDQDVRLLAIRKNTYTSEG